MVGGRFRDRRGMTLVFLAICIFALLAFAALVIDIGRLYVAKQRAQNVADAAAIAGAWLLNGKPESTDAAAAEAQEIALANNAKTTNWKVRQSSGGGEGVVVSFPAGSVEQANGSTVDVKLGEAIEAQCTVDVDYLFGQVMGFLAGRASATAVAVRRLTEYFCYSFAPWVVSDTTMWDWDTSTDPPTQITKTAIGEQCTLKIVNPNDPSGFVGPGNFLAVAYEGDRGGDDYRERVAGDGSVICFGVGSSITLYTEPGNMIGPTYQGLRDRLASDTVFPNDESAWTEWRATYDEDTGYHADTPRIVIVPIIQDPGGDLAGRKEVTVLGWAAFFIETFDKQEGVVTGRFISSTTNGEITRWGFGQSESDLILKTPRLVR